MYIFVYHLRLFKFVYKMYKNYAHFCLFFLYLQKWLPNYSYKKYLAISS